MKKTRSIEITFPAAVSFPDGFERALDALVNMVCEQYQREHPGEVMWPAGYGSKMLSNPLAMSDDEPLEFDDSVYSISVAAREDYYGENPHNPERDRLRREAIQSQIDALRAADNRSVEDAGTVNRTEAVAEADREEDDYVIQRTCELLARIAIIVNGPEPPLTRWSYHDLPEKVQALKNAHPAAGGVSEDAMRKAIQKARTIASSVGTEVCRGYQHGEGMRRACNLIEAALEAAQQEV